MAKYTVKSRVVGDIIYIDTLDESGNVVPDSMRFFEVTASTPEELQKEVERAMETVRNELGKSEELTPASVINKQEEETNSTRLESPSPAKTAEMAATSGDTDLEKREPYVKSGTRTLDAGIQQINEELKEKPEPPNVTVNVNVPEAAQSTNTSTEKTNNITEIKTGEKIESTPSSTVVDQAEKTKTEHPKEEAKVVQNVQTVPGEKPQEKEKNSIDNVKADKSKEGQSTPTDVPLTIGAAIIKYNVEHGLNPDGSAKVDKSNPGNSSPSSSSLAAIGDTEPPQDKSIRVIQSSDDNFKLSNYQQTQGLAALEKRMPTVPGDQSKTLAPSGDAGSSQSYITTPGSIVKTAADPPAKTERELELEKSKELLIKLNKLREVGWLSKEEPTKPGEIGKAIEDKEKTKEEGASIKQEIAKTVVNSPITSDLVKKPEQDKAATQQVGAPYDPSKVKKDLLTKITEEREKTKGDIAAIVKTTGADRPSRKAEKTEPKDLPEVKVKTGETKLTTEIARGIMQSSPESKKLDAVNESLARVQSSLQTIGQTQINNANNTSTINNNSSLVRNEDNRKMSAEEKREDRKPEKKEESAASQPGSNQLTEFYLHGIYDALVSQGIKIKSY